ncbi:hypothetical protein Gorai_021341, partial [Gossypium raimondii]|nr:hypothetical protein [Gossypium raimondii]
EHRSEWLSRHRCHESPDIFKGVEVKKLSPTPLMSLHRGVAIATPRPPNLVTVWGLRGMIFALVYCTAGIAVFLVHLATIPITGTGINPARSLGATIVYNRNHAWDDHWIFWVRPFIGAALYHQIIIRAIPFKTKA